MRAITTGLIVGSIGAGAMVVGGNFLYDGLYINESEQRASIDKCANAIVALVGSEGDSNTFTVKGCEDYTFTYGVPPVEDFRSVNTAAVTTDKEHSRLKKKFLIGLGGLTLVVTGLTAFISRRQSNKAADETLA